MFDLKQISPIFNAKFGVVVTIMVLTSACAHELFIQPSNNDSASIYENTPEPMGPAQASTVSQDSTKTPVGHAKRSGKVARHAYKSNRLAHNSRFVKAKSPKVIKAAAIVAAAPVIVEPKAPAPEIAPPALPAPLASAGVQTEIDGDSGNHLGLYVIYALGALAIAGLFVVAPRARRQKPKRKLVYNG